ncbi:MAG: Holliday junction resolvase RuvX [Chitinophagaceae bacterium]|nr:Holliday junction resolvase RuvX [Chitinophagaceae bacterium]MCE2973623.1 Holliday junction resolvase RuvX [Sediminibacterium sp.]MCA6468957.1 Holliday junction resolvase RuvX [Chitinophagaceae bacterium]MCA6476169.1 Holliday junction resolvase RuvX [Chitinophagaceae bacterium]MCA6476652.1 Holliday junction resolvase RuvX [Chitinophagaceae bacterium]
MGRILSIDFGGKRTGLAVTDPLQIIATALDTVDTHHLYEFLKKYVVAEQVEKIIIGYPLNLNDTPTHATPLVDAAVKRLNKLFPQVPVEKVDERFSSRRASEAMLEMGMKKKDRRQKGNTDQIAATLLLQEYLNARTQ